VTHTDSRAVEGARFVAEVAARCMRRSDEPLATIVRSAKEVIDHPHLRDAIDRALALAEAQASTENASRELGNSGFIVHTIAITAFCFVRFGAEPGPARAEVIRAGGDTDSNAAIVGAWVGALHGAAGLPLSLTNTLHDHDWFTSRGALTLGGPTHLRALARDLVRAHGGEPCREARYSPIGALLRNAALYPIALIHAVRVLLSR